MSYPKIGETVYLEPGGKPYTVLNRIGTTVYAVPAGEYHSTHQGNLYNADGKRQWHT